MKINQKGFSPVEVVIVVVVVGLLGAGGWFVYNRQNNNSADKDSTSTDNNTASNPSQQEYTSQQSKEDTADGLKYSLPSGWKYADSPVEPYETRIWPGYYILSPDYKEAGGGQLSIVTGAFISFSQHSQEDEINSSTTFEEAVDVYKKSEGLYMDRDSVKTTTVGGKQVIMYNAGHTTDDVNSLYKSDDGRWIGASFSTVTGGDGVYNAQDSEHYKTFLSWLEEFIKLNP